MTRTSPQWLGDTESKPAPGGLRRVQGLINTIDLESGADRLAAPGDAQPWLVDNGLLPPGAMPSDDDLRLLVDVREGLRAMVIHTSCGPEPTMAATVALRDVAAGSAVGLAVDESGRVTLRSSGESVAARLASLLLIVRDAQVDGSWAHLKACANDECRWAFYDRSRNHGGTWCDMASCGNRLKNRDFRARRRTGPS